MHVAQRRRRKLTRNTRARSFFVLSIHGSESLRRRVNALLFLWLLCVCAATTSAEIPIPEAHVHPDFAAYSDANDDAKLIRVSEHVYAAIGFDIGNIVFVSTDEGVLVFDTGGEQGRAQKALEALREVTSAPIVGVVYSHGHGDHTGGVDAFIPEDQRGQIPIYAGKNYQRYLRESAVPRGLVRAYYQMGYLLPKDITGSVGSGIGPAVGGAAHSLACAPPCAPGQFERVRVRVRAARANVG